MEKPSSDTPSEPSPGDENLDATMPVQPMGATMPVTPIGATQPVQPIGVTQPVQPIGATQPVTPPPQGAVPPQPTVQGTQALRPPSPRPSDAKPEPEAGSAGGEATLDPTMPVTPIGATQPVTPIGATQPVQPIGVTQPVQPIGATQPVAPPPQQAAAPPKPSVQKKQAAPPKKPVATPKALAPPEKSASPAETSKSVPDDLLGPTEPVTPIGATQPVTPIGATQPVTPIGATQPVQPIGATQPVEPIGETQPVQAPAGKRPGDEAAARMPSPPPGTSPMPPPGTSLTPPPGKSILPPSQSPAPAKPPTEAKAPAEPKPHPEAKAPAEPKPHAEARPPAEPKAPAEPKDNPFYTKRKTSRGTIEEAGEHEPEPPASAPAPAPDPDEKAEKRKEKKAKKEKAPKTPKEKKPKKPREKGAPPALLKFHGICVGIAALAGLLLWFAISTFERQAALVAETRALHAEQVEWHDLERSLADFAALGGVTVSEADTALAGELRAAALKSIEELTPSFSAEGPAMSDEAFTEPENERTRRGGALLGRAREAVAGAQPSPQAAGQIADDIRDALPQLDRLTLDVSARLEKRAGTRSLLGTIALGMVGAVVFAALLTVILMWFGWRKLFRIVKKAAG